MSHYLICQLIRQINKVKNINFQPLSLTFLTTIIFISLDFIGRSNLYKNVQYLHKCSCPRKIQYSRLQRMTEI